MTEEIVLKLRKRYAWQDILFKSHEQKFINNTVKEAFSRSKLECANYLYNSSRYGANRGHCLDFMEANGYKEDK